MKSMTQTALAAKVVLAAAKKNKPVSIALAGRFVRKSAVRGEERRALLADLVAAAEEIRRRRSRLRRERRERQARKDVLAARSEGHFRRLAAQREAARARERAALAAKEAAARWEAAWSRYPARHRQDTPGGVVAAKIAHYLRYRARRRWQMDYRSDSSLYLVRWDERTEAFVRLRLSDHDLPSTDAREWNRSQFGQPWKEVVFHGDELPREAFRMVAEALR